jgi:hypothetical protein
MFQNRVQLVGSRQPRQSTRSPGTALLPGPPPSRFLAALRPGSAPNCIRPIKTEDYHRMRAAARRTADEIPPFAPRSHFAAHSGRQRPFARVQPGSDSERTARIWRSARAGFLLLQGTSTVTPKTRPMHQRSPRCSHSPPRKAREGHTADRFAGRNPGAWSVAFPDTPDPVRCLACPCEAPGRIQVTRLADPWLKPR